MKITERIERLRAEMRREKIDMYIIPTDDHHQSEYVGEYFKFREYMTGFTGSAGTAVFTMDKAGLWTDGRYFIQAEKELSGSGVTLYRDGEEGTVTIPQFIEQELPRKGCLGFDGRTVGKARGEEYEEQARKKDGYVKWDCALADSVWEERPSLPKGEAFSLDLQYAGESISSKLSRVREKMQACGAKIHVLSSLDDIAWMLNIRGSDIEYCPLVLAYAAVYMDHVDLFADERKFSQELRKRFAEDQILLRPYSEIYSAVSRFSEDDTVMLDPERINWTLYQSISGKNKVIFKENPSVLMKSVKNETEADNMRKAHIKDGVALTRFMYWLKKNIGKIPMTEISVSDKLEELRAQQDHYLGASFAPISAYAEHAAVVHYSASKETDKQLLPKGLLLMDTGGHYLEGSTDITRTFVLGTISKEEKDHFTLTARAMLRLMDQVFLKGCSGANLDCAAREVFWKERLNFNHGTGHGVGYLLNIHEAPINFRWREGKSPAPALEKNMVITDEPGIYIEGSHGIRLENVLLVQEDEKNEYGQFMRFEPLTCVPIDLDGLIPEKMTEYEIRVMNDYHKKVRRTVGPYLPEEEREWLEEYTRPLQK